MATVDDQTTAANTTPPTPGILVTAERREDHAAWRAKVEARLDAGADKMRSLGEDLKANTAATQQVQANTSEVVDLLRSFQGAFRVLAMIGKAAKPLSYIAMAGSACLAFWAALKGGGAVK
jgi:hypothetical protein